MSLNGLPKWGVDRAGTSREGVRPLGQTWEKALTHLVSVLQLGPRN